ncbi:MAG: DUF362 domain-containing protein [Planctomycetes bacterium]|nr:DUF362 domain-containing protein [Planctomycetota bacterium]
MERRSFLRLVAISGAGLFILPDRFSPGLFAAPAKTRVVIIRNSQMRNSEGETGKMEVKRTVYEALRSLSDAGSGEELLQSIISPKDVVGIKVNAYLGDKNNATRPDVAYSLAEFLIKTGVKDNNIIIWDRAADELEQSGYVIKDNKVDIRCVATNTKRVQRLSKPMAGFDDNAVTVGSAQIKVSSIASKACSVLVNMPSLRTFKFKENTGISNAIMNMYGAVEITEENTQALYGNDCNPGAADIYNIKPIKSKTKLVICDAIYPLYNGGPAEDQRYHWNYNGIIAGLDPVAVDIVAQGIIQKHRDKVLADTPKLRSDYLETCAGSKYRLGIVDLKEIEVIEKEI